MKQAMNLKGTIKPKTKMPSRLILTSLDIVMFLIVAVSSVNLVSCRPVTTSTPTQPANTTSPLPDTTPPVISNITVAGYSDETAIVKWETDEDATGQVDYGKTDSYGNLATYDGELTINHSIGLTGLEPNTTYHFKVRSADGNENRAESIDQSFTNWVAEKEWGKYVNEENGFSIQYPSDWSERRLGTTIQGLIVVLGFLPGVIIQSVDADTPSTAQWITESFNKTGFKDFNIVSTLTDTTLSDGTKATTYKGRFLSRDWADTTVTCYCLDADKDDKRIRVIVYTVEWCEPYNEAWMAKLAHTLRFLPE